MLFFQTHVYNSIHARGWHEYWYCKYFRQGDVSRQYVIWIPFTFDFFALRPEYDRFQKTVPHHEEFDWDELITARYYRLSDSIVVLVRNILTEERKHRDVGWRLAVSTIQCKVVQTDLSWFNNNTDLSDVKTISARKLYITYSYNGIMSLLV